MTLVAFALAAAGVLAPGRDHTALVTAIAARVDAQPPLFAGDIDKLRTVTLEIAVAFRESSLRVEAEGDRDERGVARSFCAFQIHLPDGAHTREGWGKADLVADAEKCATVGDRLLRASLAMCHELPTTERLSVYARGRCSSHEGRRISRDRFALAASLLTRTRSLFLTADAASLCATTGLWPACATTEAQ